LVDECNGDVASLEPLASGYMLKQARWIVGKMLQLYGCELIDSRRQIDNPCAPVASKPSVAGSRVGAVRDE